MELKMGDPLCKGKSTNVETHLVNTGEGSFRAENKKNEKVKMKVMMCNERFQKKWGRCFFVRADPQMVSELI